MANEERGDVRVRKVKRKETSLFRSAEEIKTKEERQQRGQIGTASSSRYRKQGALESMDIC